MLNIPESVKALFMTDGTRKNFRAHFPNGELTDITNEDLVRESVSFTESMCSRDVFRFGLSEASVVEFETVGVPNMYGMLIECAYEIDTSSLSAADISAIQSNPGDGTLVLEASSDLGYGFYRVPLGVFRVESCPRNKGAMTHRQITAYSYPNMSGAFVSPMQSWVLASPHSKETATFDLFTLIASNIGYYNKAFIDQYYTRSVKYQASSMTQRSYFFNVYNGHTYFQITLTGIRTPAFSTTASSIFGYEGATIDYSALTAWIKNKGEVYGFSNEKIGKVLSKCGVYYSPGGSDLQISFRTFPENYYSFYGYSGESSSAAFVFFPTQIDVIIQEQGSTTPYESYTATSTGSPVLYEFTAINTPPSISITASNSGKDVYGNYVFTDVISLTNLLSGFLELYGEFGYITRNGDFGIKALDRASPVSVGPGDCEDAWWDEYDVSPVGSVSATFMGTNGEFTKNFTVGDGLSVYQMLENAVLKSMAGATEASVEALLSGTFSTNASNIGFTPVELTMQGWPWMEAGDALEVTAEDGTVVETYALKIEISGIQKLVAVITAEGGEIIE